MSTSPLRGHVRCSLYHRPDYDASLRNVPCLKKSGIQPFVSQISVTPSLKSHLSSLSQQVLHPSTTSLRVVLERSLSEQSSSIGFGSAGTQQSDTASQTDTDSLI